ncbi:VOC family protein [Kribbella lupini]|uniref:VOC domain-containing protein n=1 Tax=Kribbella lupini TaxID=291602 RepID=A0ABP4MHG8_9ACTN
MPAFRGVDHVSFSVTDLDRSERFYVDVLGLTQLMDFGYARILVDRPSGFMLSVVEHDAKAGGPFTELTTGLDHLGFAAESRDELVEWERRFDKYGVTYTPIRDMEFSYHLNFRDPDGIALEFSAPYPILTSWLEELRERDIPREEIQTRVGEYLASLQSGVPPMS